MAIGRMPPLEKIGVQDSKDQQALTLPTEVCNTDWGVLISHAAVAYICALVFMGS